MKIPLTCIFCIILIANVNAQNNKVYFDTSTIQLNNPQPLQYLSMHIYYDIEGNNRIRPHSLAELDSAIKIMRLLSGFSFRLECHTDCRADSMYNKRLSEIRANQLAEYIKQKLNTVSITAKGMGESNPINNCRCEGNVRSTCTEEEHQKNRRTLLIISSRLNR